MQYLNLTKGFDPFHVEKSNRVSATQFETFQFPGGEQHIKLNPETLRPNNLTWITGRFNTSNDIMLLLLAVDALHRERVTDIELFIPYLPYARQDRVMVSGEPLSIKVFSDLINACGFKRVFIYDPHSDVSAALINNCQVITNQSLLLHTGVDWVNGKSFICCPDAGAEKKIFALCQSIGYEKEIIFAKKHRDVVTGKLSGVEVLSENIPNDIYIVDDICDGGGTFVLLANALKAKNPQASIKLVVTHGIFSKGYSLENIDHTYTTDSFQQIDEFHPMSNYVTQIPIYL